MAHGREQLIETLLRTVEAVCSRIEEKEQEEPDFAVVRELAEQLKEELETLAEE